MGNEYAITIDPEDSPITDERLEEFLRVLPHYFACVKYPDNNAFEFRTGNTLPHVVDGKTKMPDSFVTGKGREILICQNGDYNTAVFILGALAKEPVSKSKVERITIRKP